ncbi:hypothetical protein IW261DRAFT_1422943 [Armillaria novae-zelandiae]|uniref:Uncharacterized protein n=1 Tax=Armillaria novae-zelandiae TaxID=153914 RepID=A0AA39NYR5_9AGAR|nr:hypothetical protein IW261DRAFT_1422943 [Armillaria novae-zelandiae]
MMDTDRLSINELPIPPAETTTNRLARTTNRKNYLGLSVRLPSWGKFGIKQVVDLLGVGKECDDHPFLITLYIVDANTVTTDAFPVNILNCGVNFSINVTWMD